MLAWRTCKVRHDPFDGAGAARHGGRWNSPGRPVVYAADSFAGSILEILAHSTRPRTLPGPHHAIQLELPDTLLERLKPEDLPKWDAPDSAAARDFGDRWLGEARSVALLVPALPCQPVGRIVMINLRHPDVGRIRKGKVFAVPWDDRLF
ncbi:MAG: RES domain-containing protein [Gemmatimonadetes bacterium]|nr:RES domain-containing protein [Gemmatimonadota bacterium]